MNPATPDQLALILNDEDIDTDRATLILQLAYDAVNEMIDPVPSGALGVILDVAARAYTVPAGVSTQTVGPVLAGYMKAGVYLTAGERRRLRALSGKGLAFMVNTVPSGAGDNLAWWDRHSSSPFGFWGNNA